MENSAPPSITKMRRKFDARTVNLRKTHPTLYSVMMRLGIGCVALGMNFFFTSPTFNPYDIPKELIGSIFLVLGVSQVVSINFYRNLKLARLTLATTASFIVFWGIGNSEQFFAGRSSLQLPIVYIILASVLIKFITEAPVNPMTQRNED